MRAMILAAGRGERMRPLTDTRPKPLLEVGGKPLIQYHLEALARAGIRDIVINLAWQGELIRARAGRMASASACSIRYSDEPEGALETGGGILAALPLLGPGPFLVISGDIWSEFPLASCIDRLAGGRCGAFRARAESRTSMRRAISVWKSGRLRRPRAPLSHTPTSACCAPNSSRAGSPGRFALAPLMFEWIRQGRVSGELYRGRWHNLGTPAQLAQLDAELRASQSRRRLIVSKRALSCR